MAETPSTPLPPHPAANILAGLLESRTGQMMSPNRFWRIETSLRPVMQQYNIPDLDSLTAVLLSVESERLVQDIVEAMLNNESSFFRDASLFHMLQHRVLSHLAAQRHAQKHIRIWCAGCSTGQEPYSLAMLFAETAHLWRGWNVEIIASDISQQAITHAKEGLYSQFEIQRGLSTERMLRFFRQEGSSWRINQAIRNLVTFNPSSILQTPLHGPSFDLVLCRNTLMYFSPEARQRAYGRLASRIADDGLLVLGASEMVIGNSTAFRASQEFRGCYECDQQRKAEPQLAMRG